MYVRQNTLKGKLFGLREFILSKDDILSSSESPSESHHMAPCGEFLTNLINKIM